MNHNIRSSITTRESLDTLAPLHISLKVVRATKFGIKYVDIWENPTNKFANIKAVLFVLPQKYYKTDNGRLLLTYACKMYAP